MIVFPQITSIVGLGLRYDDVKFDHVPSTYAITGLDAVAKGSVYPGALGVFHGVRLFFAAVGRFTAGVGPVFVLSLATTDC